MQADSEAGSFRTHQRQLFGTGQGMTEARGVCHTYAFFSAVALFMGGSWGWSQCVKTLYAVLRCMQSDAIPRPVPEAGGLALHKQALYRHTMAYVVC